MPNRTGRSPFAVNQADAYGEENVGEKLHIWESSKTYLKNLN